MIALRFGAYSWKAGKLSIQGTNIHKREANTPTFLAELFTMSNVPLQNLLKDFVEFLWEALPDSGPLSDSCDRKLPWIDQLDSIMGHYHATFFGVGMAVRLRAEGFILLDAEIIKAEQQKDESWLFDVRHLDDYCEPFDEKKLKIHQLEPPDSAFL